MKAQLGRLKSIDLRAAWTSEATQFTPWLAREENIELLGETIGMDLELEAQEKNVGPFRADILCKDTATDTWVLVENQLETTDHGHLGQLLTYAAGLTAVTIVWIAESFTEQHRAALDWLNQITDDRFKFFGLEIQLWQIGESPFAPKFNLVCKPNDWSKDAARRIDSGDLSEAKRLQLAYWTSFREFLVRRGSFLRSQKPAPQHWTNFAIGRSGIHLTAFANTRERRIAAALILDGPHAKSHYGQLERERAAIEKEAALTTEWEWRPLPDARESQILVHERTMDPTDAERWDAQHRWLAEALEALHRVFSARVKALADASPEEATE